jgi:hypothetical protein
MEVEKDSSLLRLIFIGVGLWTFNFKIKRGGASMSKNYHILDQKQLASYEELIRSD